MKQSKCISAATIAAWAGLMLAMGCDEGADERESAVQTGDLRPRPGAGSSGAGSSGVTSPIRDAGACLPPVAAQCRSDADCPVTLICKLCPDGSCADPNVHCVDGECSAPDYTCSSGTDAGAGPQCRSDADCPVLLICKLCPDGSCADPNVHCVDGECSAPDYTCSGGTDAGAGPQCRSDLDCPVTDVCKLCPDGSCANPDVRCVNGQCSAPNYTCPPAPSGTPCASSQECAADEYCTVEDGVCNRPPGCGPRGGCITLCYGTCESRAACGAEEQALEDFVSANKACKTTDDCQVLSAGCGLSFEDGCTGGVYVNDSTDTARFNALSAALTECKGSDCAMCERATLPPACIGGLCQRQRL